MLITCSAGLNVKEILAEINKAHPAIDFILEKEHRDSILFLGVSVSRRIEGPVRRLIHRKPTVLGRYIHITISFRFGEEV